MHRCFATVIEPLLSGFEPQTIAEVGAGHGRLASRLLRCAPPAGVTIHAIDPSPGAALLELAAADPRVKVYVARGTDALGRIGAVDLLLLDGDPNWSTTLAEIELAVARSREAGLPAPVIVVHGVHWPFGRRDGYHAADAPAAPLRREAAAAGLAPGRARPVDGGLRLAPFVAIEEGGARNGVMTAVEDFVAGDRADWVLVDLPGYGGTAVLADAAHAARDARLRAVLAELRSTATVRRAARRAEAGRVEAELRAAALAGDRGALDELRATVRRLERALVTTAARAELAALAPPAASGPDLALLEARLEAVGEERNRLHGEVRELVEHRAANAAARRQIERLEADLSERRHSDAQLATERDEHARAIIEARVRLEHAQAVLTAVRTELDEANVALAASRRSDESHERRIAELADTGQVLSGRVLHLEDSVDAAQAELAEARAVEAELRQRGEHARRRNRQAAELLRAERATRRARFGAVIARAFGRSERGGPAVLDRALALLDADERALPAGPVADTDSEPDRLTSR